jgi:SAM-dependent methyltransferase
MSPDKPSYTVAQHRDPEAEIARLEQQARVAGAVEEAAFRALGFPERGRVLEIGCGPGFVAARLEASRPGLHVVGVDRDADVLRRAPPTLETVVADAERLPFADNHFAAAYARLVLRHLVRPEAALAELFRVIEPAGRVIVLDSDDGALVLHPLPTGFDRVLSARQETAQRRGADPFIGRRLCGLLRDAGFGDVRSHPIAVDSIMLGTKAFARIVLSPITDGVDEDLLPRDDVDAAARALDDWADQPGSFGMTTGVVIGAAKPSASGVT